MVKQKRKKMTWKTITISYVIAISIVVPIFYQFHEPTRYSINQVFGKCEIRYNDIPVTPKDIYKVPLDIHVLSSPSYSVDWSDEEIRAFVQGASDIWGHYGIELYILGELKRNSSFSDTDVLIGISGDQVKDAILLGEKAVGDKIYGNNFNVTKVFFIRSFRTYSIDIFGIRIFPSDDSVTGKGLNTNGVSAAFVGYDKNMSWALAHELGHVLNNIDIPGYAGRVNLMTGGGCIKENYYPTTLNEEQYTNVLKKIPTIRHSQVKP